MDAHLAGTAPPVLVCSCGCTRATPRPRDTPQRCRQAKANSDEKEKKMINREQYAPGRAMNAQVEKGGETWTLILVRELRHPPARVWQALIDPEQLREWAPFEADGNLARAG